MWYTNTQLPLTTIQVHRTLLCHTSKGITKTDVNHTIALQVWYNFHCNNNATCTYAKTSKCTKYLALGCIYIKLLQALIDPYIYIFNYTWRKFAIVGLSFSSIYMLRLYKATNECFCSFEHLLVPHPQKLHVIHNNCNIWTCDLPYMDMFNLRATVHYCSVHDKD